MDAEDNGFAAGLTNCITRDGQSPPSADIPWGGKRLANLGAAAAGTDALNRDTADARYILSSVTSLTLSGALSAGSLAVSGNTTLSGTLGITGTTTLTSLNASGDLALTVNNHALRFTDVNGGNPFFIAKNDNTFGFYTTDATGAALQVYGVQTHNSSPTFAFGIAVSGITASMADNSTLFATTAYVQANITALSSVYQPLTPRLQSVTSAATVTPTATNDLVAITAQAVGLTLANPTGSPVAGQGIVIRIKDNGSPQTIAYGTQYRAIGVTLPTTTVASKNLYLGLIFNATDTKWDVVSVAQE